MNHFEDFPLSYEEDALILMHRDSHFAGQFPIMIEYYENGGVGVMEEFSLNRIKELAAYERQIGENLAPLLLSGSDAEKVGEAREAYKNLRDVYDVENPTSNHPKLISDLILAEDPEAKEEIKAIVAEKGAIVPLLIELIESEKFYDSVFPGFGEAPSHALNCLEQIGDKRSLYALFESIGKHGFYSEDVAISALKHLGKPAKDFLLKILQGTPITTDTERAAIALAAFEGDEEVAKASFDILKELNFKQQPILASFLVLASSGLQDKNDRDTFIALTNSESFPKDLKLDAKTIIKGWEQA